MGTRKRTRKRKLLPFVQATGCVRPESVLGALEHKLGERKAHLMAGNREAFARGADVAVAAGA